MSCRPLWHARRCSVICAVVIVWLAAPATAFAHARLVTSNPPDACAAQAVPLATPARPCASGIILETAPSSIRIQFSEPVQAVGRGIRVTSPSGKRVERGPVQVTGPEMYTEIEATETGTYTVIWRVIAQDTHPARGSFAFSVGQSSVTSGARIIENRDVGTVAPLGMALQVAARWLHLIGYALGFGTVLFLLVVLAPIQHATVAVARSLADGLGVSTMSDAVALGVHDVSGVIGNPATEHTPGGSPATSITGNDAEQRIWRLVGTGIVMMLVAEPVALVARGASLGTKDMLDAETLADILGSNFGLVLAQRAGAAVLLWVLVGAQTHKPRGSAWAALTLAPLVALADGHAGHAISGGRLWLAAGLDALHVMAMAGWLGGLIALVVTWHPLVSPLSTAVDISRGTLLRRFSWLAATYSFTVVASGGALAFLRLSQTADLITTNYGQTVAVKAGIVCAALLVVLVGFRSHPNERPIWWRLELAVLASVVILAGLLASLPPPR